jgi:hypothetical protein
VYRLFTRSSPGFAAVRVDTGTRSEFLEAFLIGVLSTMFVTPPFLSTFWRDTRDRFFLSFAASFMIEGFSRVAVLFVDRRVSRTRPSSSCACWHRR